MSVGIRPLIVRASRACRSAMAGAPAAGLADNRSLRHRAASSRCDEESERLVVPSRTTPRAMEAVATRLPHNMGRDRRGDA
jgi:hypothetical protein